MSCLLVGTSSLQCNRPSSFHDILLLLLVTIFFSFNLHLPVIFFSFYFCLVNITVTILLATVSSPSWYHFPYPYCNCFPPHRYHLLLFPIPLLLFFIILSVLLLVSSRPCGLILLFSSFFLVSLHLTLFKSSSPYPGCHLLFLITLLFFVGTISAFLIVSSPSRSLLLLVYLPCRYHFAYTSCTTLLLVLVFSSLYMFSSTGPNSFAFPCNVQELP